MAGIYKTKSELVQFIMDKLPDNNNKEISAQDLRRSLEQIINSSVNMTVLDTDKLVRENAEVDSIVLENGGHWKDAVLLKILALPAGDYEINWYSEIKRNSAAGDIGVTVSIGATLEAAISPQPKAGNWISFSGGKTYTHPADGDLTIRLRIKRMGSNGAVRARRSRLFIKSL